MKKSIVGKAVRIGAAVAVFASGWFCGTLSQRSADAQMGDLGKSVMEKAGDQGGALGAAAKLGDVHQRYSNAPERTAEKRRYTQVSQVDVGRLRIFQFIERNGGSCSRNLNSSPLRGTPSISL